MANLQTLKKIIAVGILGIALILGVMAYNVFKTPAEASAPIEAIPLAESATASSGLGASSQPAPTATPASQTRLEGTATTTICYADYGITIPQVRQVASVAEQVRLEIDFVT